MYTKQLFIVFFVAVFSTGCAYRTYDQLEPIEPKMERCASLADSLTPKFIWSKSTIPGVLYDFAVFNKPTVSSVDWMLGKHFVYGAPIYYREALSTNEHVVEIELNPNTAYAWSVRTRKDGRVSPWATYNCYGYAVFATATITNAYFAFITPKLGTRLRPSEN